ncbi:MAG: 4Fe-4S dicluster domain-containing protein [Pseudomonadota bacterium]
MISLDTSPAKKIAAESGVDLFSCYQCEKCTNGCPVSFAMDYKPHQIIRMLQLGLTEEIAKASSIWVCASCETCFTRCPNQIDIPKLMDYLKHSVIAKGKQPAEKMVAAFHNVFMQNIRMLGRVHETTLMGLYQMKTIAEKGFDLAEVKQNIKLGIEMFKRGRLSLIPRKAQDHKSVKRLFI